MGRVIVLGSINVDLEARIDDYPAPGEKVIGHTFNRYAGGKGANQAMAARAQGADVVMVGAVGDDEAGRASLNRLHSRGVQLHVARVPQVPTGHAIVLSDGHTNAIVVVAGANARVGTRALDPVRGLGAADILLVQLETPADKVVAAVRQARAQGVRVIVNLAPWAELPPDVIEMADPLIVPVADLSQLEQQGFAPASLIVLRGKEGLDWDGERFSGPLVPEAEVVDTVGATDALIGTLVAALALNADRKTAARLGLAAAADNVRHIGAQHDPQL